MKKRRLLTVVSLLLSVVCAGEGLAQEPPPPLVIEGADILVAPGRWIRGGMLRIEEGRIAQVGRRVKIPENARVIDLEGLILAPAFLDARNDGLLDGASARSRTWSLGACAADALRAFDERANRALLRAGVGLTYQSLGDAGSRGATGSLVVPRLDRPLPEVVQRVGGVEFLAGSVRTAARPRRAPRRFPGAAPEPEDLVVLRHGGHLHVVEDGEEDCLECGEEASEDTGEAPSLAVREEGLRVVRHGDHVHLLRPGETLLESCRGGFFGHNPLEVPSPEDEEAELLMIVGASHAHLLSPETGGAVLCSHCMQLAQPDPGPLAAETVGESPRALAPAPPRPALATLTGRASPIKTIAAAFEKARRYRKSLEDYDKKLEEWKKKLSEWKKTAGKKTETGAKKKARSGKGKPSGKRPSLRDLPPEIRKLPLRERIKYLRKLRGKNQGASGNAQSGKGDDSKGRPAPPRKPARDPASEAVLAVIDGRAPLRIEAHWEQDILDAVAFARKEKVPLVLVGASEAWKVLGDLASAGVMVVLGPPEEMSWKPLERIDARPDLARLLHEKGIPFAFMSAGVAGYGPDSLPLIAALSVGAGLPEDAALKALTTDAALILGQRNAFGSLERGKRALIQVLSGPPLDPGTRVERMIIGNRVIDLQESGI